MPPSDPCGSKGGLTAQGKRYYRLEICKQGKKPPRITGTRRKRKTNHSAARSVGTKRRR